MPTLEKTEARLMKGNEALAKADRQQADRLIEQWRYLAKHTDDSAKPSKSVLRTLHSNWMKFAHLLGKMNSYLFLTLFYWILIGPAALVLKLFGKDILDRSPKKKRSYWIDREHDPQTIERSKHQF